METVTGGARGHPRRLVVAFDGSPSSQRALSVAVAWARSWAAEELRVIHVVQEPRDRVEPTTEEEQESLHHQEEEALKAVALEASREGIHVSTILREGDPVPTILGEIQSWSPDLVLVGTRGLSWPAKVLLGSVSSGILASSRVPVVVVP